MKKLKDISKHQIKEIAEYYATLEVSRSYFTNKYDISSSTFYKILDKAVIEHIVSLKIVNMMRERAIKNTKEKLQNDMGVNRSYIHYNNLTQKRSNFIFSKSKRIKLLKEFSNREPEESKSEFCSNNFFDIELLDKMLIFSIINNELPIKVYDKIKNNSLISAFNKESTAKFFSILEELKNKNCDTSNNKCNVHTLYLKICDLIYEN